MKKHLLLIALLAASMSCIKKEECRETPYPLFSFESDYGCANTKHSLNIDLLNTVKIIRDQAAYDAEVSGECHPDINFDVYNLVIGRQVTDNINDTITYELKNTCPGNELMLTINLIQSPAAGPDTLTYHALVQKLEYQG
ncbi:MAG TPA: hypothetical protein VJ963_06270, partial [Bacteroidales bacterium]|nr:hypothetical protein [Bacteroidales bacterium]